MKRHFIILAVLISIAIPAVCAATPPRPGPYVSGFIGVSAPRDSHVTGLDYFAGDLPFDERVEFDPGINIGGTAGFDYGFFRLEGELSYKDGEIDTISDQSGNYQYRNADGTLGALALMFNAFVDLHNPLPVTPYFGGGIGFAGMHLDDTFVPGDPVPVYQEDDDSVFAYQAGAGLEIALNRVLSLDVGYRYFATSKARFNTSFVTTNTRFKSHNTAIGLRIKF